MTELRLQFKLHLRMSHGSTYGYDIIDGAGNVIGYKSSFVTKNPKRGKSQTIYTLGEQEFVDHLDGFRKAYEAQREQQRRDAEWDAAAPQAQGAGGQPA